MLAGGYLNWTISAGQCGASQATWARGNLGQRDKFYTSCLTRKNPNLASA